MNVLLTPASHTVRDHIRHLPVALFAAPMSVAGVAVAWQRLETAAQWPAVLSTGVLLLAMLTFVLLAAAYTAKLKLHRAGALTEWRHPVQICFFATIGMSLLVIASGLARLDAPTAFGVWVIGTALLAATTIGTLTAWLTRERIDPALLTPAWFLPVVGPALVAHAGVRLGYPEVSWLFFSIGLICWLFLLPLVLHRLFFGAPLPEMLWPSMVILVAPPAILFIARVELTRVELEGGLGDIGRVLFAASLLFAAVLLPGLLRLARSPFSLAWWAYSFPLAALASVLLVHGEGAGGRGSTIAGAAVLSAVTLITAYVLARTLTALMRGKLTRPV